MDCTLINSDCSDLNDDEFHDIIDELNENITNINKFEQFPLDDIKTCEEFRNHLKYLSNIANLLLTACDNALLTNNNNNNNNYRCAKNILNHIENNNQSDNLSELIHDIENNNNNCTNESCNIYNDRKIVSIINGIDEFIKQKQNLINDNSINQHGSNLSIRDCNICKCNNEIDKNYSKLLKQTLVSESEYDNEDNINNDDDNLYCYGYLERIDPNNNDLILDDTDVNNSSKICFGYLVRVDSNDKNNINENDEVIMLENDNNLIESTTFQRINNIDNNDKINENVSTLLLTPIINKNKLPLVQQKDVDCKCLPGKCPIYTDNMEMICPLNCGCCQCSYEDNYNSNTNESLTNCCYSDIKNKNNNDNNINTKLLLERCCKDQIIDLYHYKEKRQQYINDNLYESNEVFETKNGLNNKNLEFKNKEEIVVNEYKTNQENKIINEEYKTNEEDKIINSIDSINQQNIKSYSKDSNNPQDKIINSKDSLLNQQDKIINEEDKINQEDKIINSKDSLLNQQDKIITEEDKTNQEDKNINSKDSLLSQQDKKINEEDKTNQQDKIINSKNSLLNQLDKIIKLKDSINQRNNSIYDIGNITEKLASEPIEEEPKKNIKKVIKINLQENYTSLQPFQENSNMISCKCKPNPKTCQLQINSILLKDKKDNSKIINNQSKKLSNRSLNKDKSKYSNELIDGNKCLCKPCTLDCKEPCRQNKIKPKKKSSINNINESKQSLNPNVNTNNNNSVKLDEPSLFDNQENCLRTPCSSDCKLRCSSTSIANGLNNTNNDIPLDFQEHLDYLNKKTISLEKIITNMKYDYKTGESINGDEKNIDEKNIKEVCIEVPPSKIYNIYTSNNNSNKSNLRNDNNNKEYNANNSNLCNDNNIECNENIPQSDDMIWYALAPVESKLEDIEIVAENFPLQLDATPNHNIVNIKHSGQTYGIILTSLENTEKTEKTESNASLETTNNEQNSSNKKYSLNIGKKLSITISKNHQTRNNIQTQESNNCQSSVSPQQPVGVTYNQGIPVGLNPCNMQIPVCLQIAACCNVGLNSCSCVHPKITNIYNQPNAVGMTCNEQTAQHSFMQYIPVNTVPYSQCECATPKEQGSPGQPPAPYQNAQISLSESGQSPHIVTSRNKNELHPCARSQRRLSPRFSLSVENTEGIPAQSSAPYAYSSSHILQSDRTHIENLQSGPPYYPQSSQYQCDDQPQNVSKCSSHPFTTLTENSEGYSGSGLLGQILYDYPSTVNSAPQFYTFPSVQIEPFSPMQVNSENQQEMNYDNCNRQDIEQNSSDRSEPIVSSTRNSENQDRKQYYHTSNEESHNENSSIIDSKEAVRYTPRFANSTPILRNKESQNQNSSIIDSKESVRYTTPLAKSTPILNNREPEFHALDQQSHSIYAAGYADSENLKTEPINESLQSEKQFKKQATDSITESIPNQSQRSDNSQNTLNTESHNQLLNSNTSIQLSHKSSNFIENTSRSKNSSQESENQDKSKPTTPTNVTEKQNTDSNEILRLFIQSLFCNLKEMHNVIHRVQTNTMKRFSSRIPILPPGFQALPVKSQHCNCNQKLDDSYPVTIESVRPLGQCSLLVKWFVHDYNNIAGYEIYIDGIVSNRYYSPGHTSSLIYGVDLYNRHIIVLKSSPLTENKKKNYINFTERFYKPTNNKMSSKPWIISSYVYDPY